MDRGIWQATVHGLTESDMTKHTRTHSQSPQFMLWFSNGLLQARILSCHALLQGIFGTQGSNPHPCVSCIGRQVLYHQCHLGRPVQSIGFDKCIMTCIHHYNIIRSIFSALKLLCAPPIHTQLQPLANMFCFVFYCLHRFCLFSTS